MRIMANFKNPAVVEQCAMRLLPFAEQWRQPGDLVCTNADFSALLQGIGSHALNEESSLSLLYFLALTPNDSASQAERCKALLLARLDAVGDDAPDMRSAFQTDHVERLNAGPALFQPAGLRLLLREAWKIVPEEEIYLSVHKDNLASLQVQKNNGATIHHEDAQQYYTRIRR